MRNNSVKIQRDGIMLLLVFSVLPISTICYDYYDYDYDYDYDYSGIFSKKFS